MNDKSNFLTLSGKLLEGKMTERAIQYFALALLFIISSTFWYQFGKGIFFSQENRSLFIFSSDYFHEFSSKPGGLLTYAGNFLTQGYFNSIYGSLLLSILLILLCGVFIKINKRLSANKLFSILLIFVLSAFLLYLQARYDFFSQHTLGYLLVALWFLISVTVLNIRIRIIVLGLFPLFYYVIGSYAFIYLGMFIVFCLVFERGFLRFFLPSLLIVITLLTLFVFKEFIFLQPLDRLLRYPLLFTDVPRLQVILFLFCGFLISFPLLIKATALINVNIKFAGILKVVVFLTGFLLIIFLLFMNYEPVKENLMQLEKYVCQQDWDAIIKQQERNQTNNVIAEYYYNLALSEKNQLCDRMFFCRQNYGSISLTLTRNQEQSYRAVYFYYAIGLISEAHHLAFELMVQHGYTPENIKLLIKTELINGNLRVAERYINVLKKTLHYRIWAEKYENMLSNTQLINSDPELGEKISLLPKKDFFIATNDLSNIDLLLNDNPENKRAFEYKMAKLLLEKDFMAVAEEAKKMKAIGYAVFPRHIEEAVVVCANLSKESPDLGGLSIKPETVQRFLQYRTTYNLYKGNKSLLDKEMKKSEKNTFFYYLQFSFMNRDFTDHRTENNSIN
jgi:hypothetical protein